MVFFINNVDFSGYVMRGGFKVEKFKITTEDSGRDTQDAEMYLSVMAVKHKITATCRPLTNEEVSALFSVLGNTWVTVEFLSPYTGKPETMTMYSDNLPATFLIERGGVGFWSGIEFPLIEK